MKYELNNLYNVDCMEAMKEIPDKYFDLAIVDPPYGRKEHGGKNRSKYVVQKNGSKIFVRDGEYVNENWDNEPPKIEFFDELLRISEHQIIWGINYMPVKLTSSGRIVWDKVNGGSDQSDCEIAYNSLTDRVDKFAFMWRGMMHGKSISEGYIQKGNKKLNEKRINPAQKPVDLYIWTLQKYAQSDWKILDTHVGSASSLIACHRLGFAFMGFELNRENFGKASKRIEKERSQMMLDFD